MTYLPFDSINVAVNFLFVQKIRIMYVGMIEMNNDFLIILAIKWRNTTPMELGKFRSRTTPSNTSSPVALKRVFSKMELLFE